MKTPLKLVSYAGLALSVVPAVLLYRGAVEVSTYRWLMIAGMVLWFGTAIFWIRPDHAQS